LHRILDDEPKILDDSIAARLLGDEFDRYRMLVRFFPFSALIHANFIMHSRYAEDCLAESLRDGLGQYVLLGAGLDTFAYRQPEWASSLRIFEVDYPATQNWKRGRLTAANTDPNQRYSCPSGFRAYFTSRRAGRRSRAELPGANLLFVAGSNPVPNRRCLRPRIKIRPFIAAAE